MATATATAVLSIFLVFFISLPNESSASKTSHAGFKVDLIHPDSPQSPFYQPSATFADRAKQAIVNSKYRLQYFKSSFSMSVDAISSPVTPSGGGYLMKLSYGTPPFQYLAILDTGSDLIWTQCQPCDQCYKQDRPLFNPKKSSTYRYLPCSSELCKALSGSSTCNNGCQYSYHYGDQSYTDGVLASETLTFDSSSSKRPVKIPKIGFGCGHNNGGTFGSHAAGLVGMGGGPLSLISQLGSSVKSKFSYCFGPLFDNTSRSALKFGDDANVSGKDVVSTPITKTKGLETFYYLTLEDISVGSKKLKIPRETFHVKPTGEGGLIIDSGTTLTILNTDGYDILVSALQKAINLTRTLDPTGNFELCYVAHENFDDAIPDVTFHFSGDADVHLKPLNTFVQVKEGTRCLAMVSDESISIFGNLSQQNYLVVYDLAGETVSFAATDCNKVE